jgi:asparagine synthase (glutamine-hydrolysing)
LENGRIAAKESGDKELGGASLLRDLDIHARSAVASASAQNCIILYSGGVDSSILLHLVTSSPICKNYFVCGAGIPGSQDDKLKSEHSRPIHFFAINRASVVVAAAKVTEMVEPISIAMFEDCIAFYLIFKALNSARKGLPCNEVLTANGPDELFCGYDRFRRIVEMKGYAGVETEITRSLGVAKVLSTEAEKIATNFGFITKQPFLDRTFVDFSRGNIPARLNLLPKDDYLRKRFWREYALWLGLPREVAFKPKKAMQYSMGIHKEITSLSRKGLLTMPDSLS